MARYAFRRVLTSIPVLFAVLIATFSLGYFGPGDPLVFMAGEEFRDQIDPELLARLRKLHGLDRPYFVQFGDYTWSLLRGDWGDSILNKRPVFKQMTRGINVSAQMGLAATVVLVVVGIPLGALAAVRQNTWIDYWIVSFSISVRSIPIFVLAPMLMIVFVLWLDVISTPVGWSGIFHHKAILPVLLIAAGPLLVVVRQTRAGVLEVIGQNYVRTARAKGLRERRVIRRHVMKNALTPVLTSMGLILSSLITGALFVELIFAVPGFAGLAIFALQSRDYPMIMGTTIVAAAIIVAANLLVDIGYGFLDPRVRYD